MPDYEILDTRNRILKVVTAANTTIATTLARAYPTWNGATPIQAVATWVSRMFERMAS